MDSLDEYILLYVSTFAWIRWTNGWRKNWSWNSGWWSGQHDDNWSWMSILWLLCFFLLAVHHEDGNDVEETPRDDDDEHSLGDPIEIRAMRKARMSLAKEVWHAFLTHTPPCSFSHDGHSFRDTVEIHEKRVDVISLSKMYGKLLSKIFLHGSFKDDARSIPCLSSLLFWWCLRTNQRHDTMLEKLWCTSVRYTK